MAEVVLKEVQDGVAVLTLNRPDRLNAWTQELERRYFELLAECASDERVRVIVVTGAGRGFCAGADMQELQTLGEDGVSAEQRDGERTEQIYPLSVPKPIVAAINGPCAGIGLVQALMCDVRFAAEDAKLTTAFARRGLIAEHGISWILPASSVRRARSTCCCRRACCSARRRRKLGLVNEAIGRETVLEHAIAYARDLAVNCSPASMATIKRQVYADLTRTAPQALAEADRLMLASFEGADFGEGVTSFLERREPRFAPLAGALGDRRRARAARRRARHRRAGRRSAGMSARTISAIASDIASAAVDEATLPPSRRNAGSPGGSSARPSARAQRPATRAGSRTATVMPASCPGARLPICPVQLGPPQRQEPNGSERSSETIAPPRSAGCRCVPAMSGRSIRQIARMPSSATRARAASSSSRSKIAI